MRGYGSIKSRRPSHRHRVHLKKNKRNSTRSRKSIPDEPEYVGDNDSADDQSSIQEDEEDVVYGEFVRFSYQRSAFKRKKSPRLMVVVDTAVSVTDALHNGGSNMLDHRVCVSDHHMREPMPRVNKSSLESCDSDVVVVEAANVIVPASIVLNGLTDSRENESCDMAGSGIDLLGAPHCLAGRRANHCEENGLEVCAEEDNECDETSSNAGDQSVRSKDEDTELPRDRNNVLLQDKKSETGKVVTNNFIQKCSLVTQHQLSYRRHESTAKVLEPTITSEDRIPTSPSHVYLKEKSAMESLISEMDVCDALTHNSSDLLERLHPSAEDYSDSATAPQISSSSTARNKSRSYYSRKQARYSSRVYQCKPPRQRPMKVCMFRRPRKILVLGDMMSGKSNLISAYCNDRFRENYIPTMLCCLQTDVILSGEKIDLVVIDISGRDDYKPLRCSAYHKLDAAIICYPVDSLDSFKRVQDYWVPELKRYVSKVPFVVVGTKRDVRDEARDKMEDSFDKNGAGMADRLRSEAEFINKFVTHDRGKRISQELGAAGFYECCAVYRDGTRKVFESTTKIALQKSRRKRKVGSKHVDTMCTLI